MTEPPVADPDILLFRHAATDMGDGPRRYIGRTEVPLSAEGRAQAAAWRSRLAALNVAGAYASPLGRALDTARLMLGQGNAAADTHRAALHGASRIPITVLDDLAERHLGEWDGLPQAQVGQGSPDVYARRGQEPWTFRPPGGEWVSAEYRADYRALAPADPAEQWRGCVVVAMELTVNGQKLPSDRTWCPGAGVIAGVRSRPACFGRAGQFPRRSLDRVGAVGRTQSSALMAARVLE